MDFTFVDPLSVQSHANIKPGKPYARVYTLITSSKRIMHFL